MLVLYNEKPCNCFWTSKLDICWNAASLSFTSGFSSSLVMNSPMVVAFNPSMSRCTTHVGSAGKSVRFNGAAVHVHATPHKPATTRLFLQ